MQFALLDVRIALQTPMGSVWMLNAVAGRGRWCSNAPGHGRVWQSDGFDTSRHGVGVRRLEIGRIEPWCAESLFEKHRVV